MAADDDAFHDLVRTHERALRVHCYRLLGSLQDAEDQTQETLLRAWRSRDAFEGRSSLRAWLYRIATNACLDLIRLDRRGRARLLPAFVGQPTAAFGPSGGVPDDTPWLEPFPDALFDLADDAPGPEARYETKELIELAFIAALQHLAPRQRAVLLLRDVLGLPARDVATLLDMSVAAANSALQRARDRLDGIRPSASVRLDAAAERALVERYVGAWERGDIATFVSLLRDDATLSMPPLAEWYRGPASLAQFFAWATGPVGPGPFRFVPTRANNSLAFGIYDAAGEPRILQVVTADQSGIATLTSFMNPALFSRFGLPPRLASPATPDPT
jgi:RNA polymerase sigma-70 factor (ECF subfamily)